MADPRRLREILGFGYGAPSPAMSALEPFHAGVDPAYMPEDVVTASPGEGPSPYVRRGIENLLGTVIPDRWASQWADKLSPIADLNPFQGAYDFGKGLGDAVQGGDGLDIAMSMIPGKVAEGATKVAKELDLPAAVKEAQKLIVRDKGSNIGSDALAGLTREGHYYRGMTDAEFNATLGSGQGVKSNNEYSLKGEGTSFAGDAPTAESYVNYGRDDPRKTGKPNYLVEVRAGENIESKPDGYYHAREGLSPEQVQRVWRMEDNDGALVAVPHDLVPAVKAAQKSIKAYHGTPHDFDKFDISKIGTGEGAQAYGHGLYFAENEGVARGYRDRLTRLVGDEQTPMGALDRAFGITNSPEEARKTLEGNLRAFQKQGSPRAAEYEEAIRMLDAGVKPGGSMYEVNINADPDAFLDWDKPLSEQHPLVQQLALEADLSKVPSRTRRTIEAWRGEYTPPEGVVVPPATGNDLHSALTDYGTDPNRNAALTERLKQAGIPGIKYLDAGSRFIPANLPNNPIANEARKFLEAHDGDSKAALEAFYASNPVERFATTERDEVRKVIEAAGKKPSRNYVVFSDEIIDIVKKYGIAGALGAGLITQQMADQLEAQQGGGQS